MENLSELRVELPSFPVYKSYVLPYRSSEDQIVDLLEVNEDIVQEWKSMVSSLKEFLTEGLAYTESRNLSEVEKIELINDLIIIFLRIPLIRELLPAVSPSPLKSYLFYRLNEPLITDAVENVLEYVYAFYDRLTKTGFTKTAVSRFFDDLNLCELVERCWFEIPADTRPGLNTCGLIPHMLLSSAIAWTLAVERDLPRNEVAIITLATLLHDIGKPIKYKKHVEASTQIARWLLENLLAKETVDRVVELIGMHHLDVASTEVRIIKEADQIASRIDRLSNLFKDLLKDELRKLSEETGIDIQRGYEGGDDSWGIWENLHKVKPDAIRELSTLFVQKIRNLLKDYQLTLKEVKSSREVEGVRMCLVDVGSIQDFIMSSSELRCVVASSLIVDTLTVSLIPVEIQRSTLHKSRLPLGNIVYAAGGVVEFIIPEKLYEDVLKTLERLNEKTSRIGLPLRVASTTLKDHYPETFLDMAREIQLVKLKVKNVEQPIRQIRSKEVRNLCQICYLRTPDTEIETPEGMKKACNVCKRLYEIGSEMHFKQRYESEISIDGRFETPRKFFGKDWEEISKYILEVIAGHDEAELEELERFEVRYRNLAVMKFDGNLMGPFMASSISLTDVCERSARIDLALKKAIDTAIKKVFRAVRDVGGEAQAFKTISQIKLGLMYAGGDDALIFLPSWLSIGFAMVVGREFHLNMGKARGLSIGLAVGKSKADIWALISAASKLMEESKKEIGRRTPSHSCICFDVSETSTLTGASVKSHLESLKIDGLSAQPLRIDGDPPSLEQLISLTISEDVDPIKIFENCYLLSRRDENDVKKKAKHIRKAIADSLSNARHMAKKIKDLEYFLIPLSAVYAYRQSYRDELGEDVRKAFKVVTRLRLSKNAFGENLSMYSDADRLIKICGGGML